MQQIEVITNTTLQSQKLGMLIGRFLVKGDVITLSGNLGAGKTTLAQGIAKGLDINGIVNSPTFNIIKCYFHGRLPFYHIDAYRLEGIKQDLGWDEYFEGDGVCLVEWPNFIDYALPSDYLEIKIETIDDTTRKYILIGKTERYETLLRDVKNNEHTIID
jgi:tRNA threonylcarbamoyladenosine biosynthesis protein TsaE